MVIGCTSASVDATDLARYLAAPPSEGGLGLRAALNLDGGRSAQLWVRQAGPDGADLSLPAVSAVPVMLTVRATDEARTGRGAGDRRTNVRGTDVRGTGGRD